MDKLTVSLIVICGTHPTYGNLNRSSLLIYQGAFSFFCTPFWNTSCVQCFRGFMRPSSNKNQGGKENVCTVGPVFLNIVCELQYTCVPTHVCVCVCNFCQMFVLCIYLSVYFHLLYETVLLLFCTLSLVTFLMTCIYGCPRCVALCNVWEFCLVFIVFAQIECAFFASHFDLLYVIHRRLN
jgi:hypothetical protein